MERLDQEVVEQTDVDGVRRDRQVVVSTEENRPNLRVKPSCLAQQVETGSSRDSSWSAIASATGASRSLQVAEEVDRLRGAIEARALIAPRGESAVELALQGAGHPRVASHSEEKRPHLA